MCSDLQRGTVWVSQVLMLWAGNLLCDLNAGLELGHPVPNLQKVAICGYKPDNGKTCDTFCGGISFYLLPATCECTFSVKSKFGAPLMSNENFLPGKTAQWLVTEYLATNCSMSSKPPYLHFFLYHLPSFPDILPYLHSQLCSLSSNFFWSLHHLIREATLRGPMDLSYVLQLCKIHFDIQTAFISPCLRRESAS